MEINLIEGILIEHVHILIIFMQVVCYLISYINDTVHVTCVLDYN